jgi:hypothetical protein
MMTELLAETTETVTSNTHHWCICQNGLLAMENKWNGKGKLAVVITRVKT